MDKALKVLRDIEELGKKQFIPLIGPFKGRVITNIIKKYKIKNILEIGTLFGYSSILMGINDVRIITIEIDKDNAIIARKNIEKAGLTNKIKVINGDALKILPKIKEKFELLFIDAKKSDYLKYLKLAEKNLKKNSIIIADNVEIFKEYMLDYLDYVKNSGKYKSETIKVREDALEISIKF